MLIDQLKLEGGHGLDPEIIERADYLLSALRSKLCVVEDDVTGEKCLLLSAANNKKGQFEYRLFLTLSKDGMSVAFQAGA